MQKNNVELLDEVAHYYSEKITVYGQTARGVDWNGEQSQHLRFKQLLRIIDTNEPFSLLDLGCGYGALYEFMATAYDNFSYIGTDISEKMIEAARARFSSLPNARFIVSGQSDSVTDYAVASGIFNVRLNRSDKEWFEYIQTTLNMLNQSTEKGFAFNCLTSYSDAEKMRDYLYYADPCAVFHLCKANYSKEVALLHDYGLFEFTLLVRKSI